MGYTKLIVADYFQQQVLILFFIDAVFQHLVISNKFKVLTDGCSDHPCKGIVPVEQAKYFAENDVNTMPLFYMHKLMTDYFFQFFCGMQVNIDEYSITKRKRDDGLIHLVKAYPSPEINFAFFIIRRNEINCITNRDNITSIPITISRDIIFQTVRELLLVDLLYSSGTHCTILLSANSFLCSAGVISINGITNESIE